MFVLTSSVRSPKLTSWHFGAGGDILGQNMLFFSTKKKGKTGISFQNCTDPSMGCNFAWLESERVLSKTCAAIKKYIYLKYKFGVVGLVGGVKWHNWHLTSV